MPQQPVPADPGRDEDLAWLDRDPMTAEEREAWLDRVCEHDDPPEPEEYEDFPTLTPEELAEIGEAAADELLAVTAATTGRRGPGQPGSARVFPGESSSRAAAFGPGMPLDVLPGCAQLAVAADAAAGDDGFAGVSEAELVGVLCAWDRVEAHAAARKLAAIGELARRNPGPLDEEFTADQLACALGESRARADALLGTAAHLDTHLPGTRDALLDGTLSMSKAQIIANATGLLDPAEAAAAEAEVLDRAARLTPPGLRAAIARAVIKAAPKKAKERRENAAKDMRVERWTEDSGNAALMGRELPPAEVLAADQRITAWAKELGTAGLEGDMDQLRARAYLDLLLAKDSRPRPPATVGGDGAPPQMARTTAQVAQAARRRPGTRRPGRAGQVAGRIGRRSSRRVCRPGYPDRPARHPGPPGRPARRTRRPGPHRPLANPRPRRRRRAQPEDHLVRNSHRREGARRRPRLRPPRTQESQEPRRPGPPGGTGFSFTPASRDGPSQWVRHLAAAHPRTRTRSDHHPGPPDHRPVQPPARKPGPRPWRQAPAPVPDPARHLHQPHLPAARRPVRRRAQHPVRGGRPDLPVQHRSQVPARPPAQAAPQVEGRPAPRRHLPVDNPSRPDLRHRTHPLPDLNG